MRWFLGFLITLVVASPALAADLTVTVRDSKGAPVEDAVVTLESAASAGAGPIRFPWPYRMVQRDIAFHPFVLIVPVGAEVRFPNNDKVRHHVYSFSAAKKFQLKLYGEDESRSVVFDKAGTVGLGCNIHDRMMAFIDVVDTPWAAKTSGGVAVLADAPSGPAVLTVWHPFMTGKPVRRSIVLPARGQPAEAAVIDLRPPVAAAKMRM